MGVCAITWSFLCFGSYLICLIRSFSFSNFFPLINLSGWLPKGASNTFIYLFLTNDSIALYVFIVFFFFFYYYYYYYYLFIYLSIVIIIIILYIFYLYIFIIFIMYTLLLLLFYLLSVCVCFIYSFIAFAIAISVGSFSNLFTYVSINLFILSVLVSVWHKRGNHLLFYSCLVYIYLSIWDGGSCLYVIILGMWRDVFRQSQARMTLFGILDVTSRCPWWSCITSDWLSK